jgi:CRP/FNR family transcriptional regulator
MEKSIDLKESIFNGLAPREIRSLEESAEVCQYTAGEWIVHHGDVWPYFFIVVEGQVTALKESYEGRSLILTTLRAGEVFWGLAFFIPEASMPASLQAAENTKLLRWPRETLMPFLMNNGQLSWKISCLMIQRVQLASEIVEKLAFHPVAGRLARLLVELSPDEKEPVARDLTLDEMAAHIGTTREVVCRFLHRFASDGLIHITRTEFTVHDRARLEELSRQGRQA